MYNGAPTQLNLHNPAPGQVMTVNHRQLGFPGIVHDPVVVWIEGIDATGFVACLREVDADNNHDAAYVHWTATGP